MVRRSARRLFRTSLALVAAFGAVAAAPASAGAADRPESCTLFKAREVAAALGRPAARGVPGKAPQICDWRVPATAEAAAGTVHVQVARGGRAPKSFALAERFHAAEQVPLGDLGRKAFFAPSLGTVWVLEDRTTVYYVQGLFPGGGPEPDALRAALVQLAGVAEARL